MLKYDCTLPRTVSSRGYFNEIVVILSDLFRVDTLTFC